MAASNRWQNVTVNVPVRFRVGRTIAFCGVQTDKILETRANVGKMLDRADALAEYTLLAERVKVKRCSKTCSQGAGRIATVPKLSQNTL